MTDVELQAVFADFGLDANSREALLFLPLVWVAWADGTLHPEERALILELAARHVSLGAEGQRVLNNWLSFVPDRALLERGAAALVALDLRMRLGKPTDVVDFCRQIADVSGPFFGRIEAPEREAIEAVANYLSRDPSRAWSTVRARLDEMGQLATPNPFDDGPTNPRIPADAVAPSVPAALGASGLVWLAAGVEHRIPLTALPVSVGRGRDNTLQLAQDAELSRRHVELFAQGQGIYVRDLDSSNGVRVNGDRVKERRLFGGELIQLGATTFRYRP